MRGFSQPGELVKWAEFPPAATMSGVSLRVYDGGKSLPDVMRLIETELR